MRSTANGKRRLRPIAIATGLLALIAFIALWALPTVQHNRDVALAAARGAENPEEAARRVQILQYLNKFEQEDAVMTDKQFDMILRMKDSDSIQSRHSVSTFLASWAPERRKAEAIETILELLYDEHWYVQFGALQSLHRMDKELGKRKSSEFLNHPVEPLRMIADQYHNNKPLHPELMEAFEKAIEDVFDD